MFAVLVVIRVRNIMIVFVGAVDVLVEPTAKLAELRNVHDVEKLQDYY